jgi:hypothetical protein
MAVRFIGGGNRSTLRKPPTCLKSLTNCTPLLSGIRICNVSGGKDYYKILGVSKTATEDEIKKHYRKRALVHHPGKLVQLALCHMWSICFVWGEGIERRRCSIKHYIVLTSAIGTIVVVIVW